jgi:signal transduction histidine kinase
MKSFVHSAGLALCLALAAPALADNADIPANHATREQAVAMVKKAVAAIKADGADKTYAEIDKTDGKFVDHDLYIVVYGTDGKCLAHGANSKLIGQDLLDSEDADGKPFVKERVELAKSKDNFWQSYKFANPVTHKVAPKETYCEKLDNTVVCGGVYKY